MIESTIDDEKGLSARDLAVDYLGNVNSSFADEVTAEFNNQRRAWKVNFGTLGKLFKVFANACQVKSLFSWKVGDSESSAEVEETDR